MSRRGLAALVSVAVLLATACGDDAGRGATTDTAPTTLRVEDAAPLAHDTSSFTEGLELDGDVRYESSGLYGESVVRAIDRRTGTVLHTFRLPPSFFGEGLTKSGDRLLVLTWKERTVFVLDAATLTERARIAYDKDGWGICALGDLLVTSDGSDVLTFRDPVTLAAHRTVPVRLSGTAVSELNELECTDDGVYANVWRTDRIVRIDPATGTVTGVLDVPQLRPASTAADPDAVLNGIAHDPTTGRFLLTGKRWPVLYDVKITES